MVSMPGAHGDTARVLMTFSPPANTGDAVGKALDGLATTTLLPEVSEADRARALSEADAVLAWRLGAELQGPEEFALLRSVGLIQLLSAGVDHVPFDRLPEHVPVASNAGAYAGPMAEHVLAMALSLAKRLAQNHAGLARGEFDQQTLTKELRGAVVGVLGFGGIGQASARLFRCLGARIHAVNRSGRTEETVERIGTLGELDALLAAADVLVIALPLTRATRGLIGSRELSLMKADAILINVARAAILDEDALYEHLRGHPSFSAGIDTWWQEPGRAERFATKRPLFELPNLLGSPHNSGLTPGSLAAATGDAAANIARHLRGELVRNLVNRSDYVD